MLIQTFILKKKKYNEHFVSQDIPLINTYTLYDSDETITDIQQNLVTYLTAFNKKSFNNIDNIWYNIANLQPDGTINKLALNYKYTFSLQPTFTKKNGFYLGNNFITGPLSNNLDIIFHNTYTIVITCKHGSLMVTDNNTEIELFKLYANSPNNNGIVLYIPKNSIANVNNTQVGTLLFQYANNPPLQCLADNYSQYINFDKDVVTYYFIVKDTDNIRILMMNENSTTIYQILKLTITNTDINFSNKELMINRMANWNANIYNFSIFNTALTDEAVSTYYTHFNDEYIKHIDNSFNTISGKYNNLLTAFNSASSCPYDSNVSNKCSTIKNWNDMYQIVNSTQQCKKSINDYCSINVKHPKCICWDTSSSSYKTEACQTYRNLYSTSSNLFDELSPDNIDYIKKKYNLIYPSECPKPITQPEFITNQYQSYDWEKLKVYLDSNAPATNSNSYINTSNNYSVTNFFKEDPNLNDNTVINSILSNKITDVNIQKTTAANITPIVTDTINTKLVPTDNFFNKFMKIVIPPSS